MGALLEYFSVSRNNDEALGVTLESDIVGDSLTGATIEWLALASTATLPSWSMAQIASNAAGLIELALPGRVLGLLRRDQPRPASPNAYPIAYPRRQAAEVDRAKPLI